MKTNKIIEIILITLLVIGMCCLIVTAGNDNELKEIKELKTRFNESVERQKEHEELKITYTMGLEEANAGIEAEKEIQIELASQLADKIGIKETLKVVEKEWKPGDLNSDGTAQEMPVLTGADSHSRFIEMSNAYGLDPKELWRIEDKHKIKEGVLLCITIAETSGGNKGNYVGDGCYNLGNVGNMDNPNARHCYSTPTASIEGIGKTLNNKYLGSKTTLACLSNAGNCKELNDNGKRYATSTGNRERNMVACLSDIYGYEVNADSFNIRR